VNVVNIFVVRPKFPQKRKTFVKMGEGTVFRRKFGQKKERKRKS